MIYMSNVIKICDHIPTKTKKKTKPHLSYEQTKAIKQNKKQNVTKL